MGVKINLNGFFHQAAEMQREKEEAKVQFMKPKLCKSLDFLSLLLFPLSVGLSMSQSVL